MTHTVTFGLCQFDHINPTVSVSVIAFNVETDQDNPGQWNQNRKSLYMLHLKSHFIKVSQHSLLN
jgi:hypothetical protein